MQLRRTASLVAFAAVASIGVAHADDGIDVNTTWYQEQRQGGQGGLTVIHPQLDATVDVGEHSTLSFGYAADAVTGATAKVYAVDAVSTATPFSDLRHEGNLGLAFAGRRSKLAVSGAVGVERDYLSLSVGATGSVDLPGKNTNLALAYSHARDQVCDKSNGELQPLERRALTGADPCAKDYGVFGKDTVDATMTLATTWRDLSIDTAQGTLTQNLSPTTVMQLSLYGQVLDGFQSNPYRQVRVGPNEPQEHVPDTRARVALSVRLNRYLPKLRAAVHVRAARTATAGASTPAPSSWPTRSTSAPRCSCACAPAPTSRPPRRSSRTRSSTRPSRPPGRTSPATASCRRCATPWSAAS
jgi:hypothetical protein